MYSNSSLSPRCLFFPESPHQCDVIVIIKRITASLSIIGCLFMIFVIWLFKKYQAFAQRLILCLTIAALLDAFAAMGDLREDGPLCNFEGWYINFTSYSVLLWVCCITFNLFMNAVKMKKVSKYEWAYHVFSWGIAIVVSCFPLFWDQYKPAGAWCWLNDWKWRFGIWYVPLFICLTGLVVTFVYISVYLYKKTQTWEGLYDPDIERQKQMLKEDVKPLRAYPLAYLLLNVLPLVNRIHDAVSPHSANFVLMILMTLTSPLIGAVNAIIFGLDRETVSHLSCAEIRLTLRSRFSSPSLIREYPAGPTDYGNVVGSDEHEEVPENQ